MGYTGPERRKFPRVQFTCEVLLKNSGVTVRVKTANIGIGGVRVFSGRAIERATQVSLKMLVAPMQHIICNGYVVWCAQQVNTGKGAQAVFDIGIQFEGMQPNDKVYIAQLIERTSSDEETLRSMKR